MDKIDLKHEFKVKCKYDCMKCPYNQKPSTCEPWDNALQTKFLISKILNVIDKLYGVENKIVDD